MTIKNILFDLDGTLTDSKEGIIKSIQYALEKVNQPTPSTHELHWCIGPPLIRSFDKLLGTKNFKLGEKAIKFYRERYNRIGKFENQVFYNIPETLYILQKRGFFLFVATSKPYFFAKQIMDHFELESYFEKIYGSELDGSLCDKTDLINHIIQKESLTRSQTIMIGDRKHDVIGAKNNNIRSISVTYGYGSLDELNNAKADFIVNTHSELPKILKTI
jgi:phosphoglycolate phosphatase